MKGGTAVWTDFGGVLTPPIAEDLAGFCARIGVAPEALRAAMKTVGDAYGTDPMAPLDTPLITEEEWARQVEQALRDHSGVNADLSNFGERWFSGRPANQAWIDHLRRLRAEGCFVGMLSNMPPSWEPLWRAMVPADELFDEVVCSHAVGCRKPESAIYALASRRADRPPEQCVLVDDVEPNCAGARSAGWQAVHFTTTDEAIRTLAELARPVVSQARTQDR